jgi:hypothetical protein
MKFWCGSGSGSCYAEGEHDEHGVDDQKVKKKKYRPKMFLIKIAIYLFTYVQATGEDFSLQKRTSSTSKMKFLTFFYVLGSILPSWRRIRVLIANPDTYPGTPLNRDPIRIRIWIRICFDGYISLLGSISADSALQTHAAARH